MKKNPCLPSLFKGFFTKQSVSVEWSEVYHYLTGEELRELTDRYRATKEWHYKSALLSLTPACGMNGKGKEADDLTGLTGFSHGRLRPYLAAADGGGARAGECRPAHVSQSRHRVGRGVSRVFPLRRGWGLRTGVPHGQLLLRRPYRGGFRREVRQREPPLCPVPRPVGVLQRGSRSVCRAGRIR